MRVILADHKPYVGSDMGESARPVIEEALASLGVETRLGIEVVSIDPSRGSRSSRASRSVRRRSSGAPACGPTRSRGCSPSSAIRFGRLPVDEFLRVKGVPDVFAAGDVGRRHDGQPPRLGHVLPAWPSHGPFRRAQRRLRSVRRADAALADRLVRHGARPGAVGGRLHRGMGSARRREGCGGQKDQADHQLPAASIPPLNRNRQEILAAAAPTIQPPPENYR